MDDKETTLLLKELVRKIDTLYLAIQGDKAMGHIGIIDKMGDIVQKVEEHSEELRKIKEEKSRNRWIVAAIATGAGLGSEKIVEIIKRIVIFIS